MHDTSRSDIKQEHLMTHSCHSFTDEGSWVVHFIYYDRSDRVGGGGIFEAFDSLYSTWCIYRRTLFNCEYLLIMNCEFFPMFVINRLMCVYNMVRGRQLQLLDSQFSLT